MDYTLTQLVYAVAVDRHRHFAHAAAACGVTQPTLSMQIAKLERSLGILLFDRTHTPLTVTEQGALVLDQARATLREAARVQELAHTEPGVIGGELRIGVIPTLAPYLLPRVVQQLRLRHPALELVVEERITDDVLGAIRRDELDAGIIASEVDTPGLVERPLFNEPFVGYISAGHRLAHRRWIAPADLSLDDLWLLSEGHCFRMQALQLCEQRARQRGRSARTTAPIACTTARFESGNLETLKRLVENGDGMTLLPALAAKDLQTAAARRRLRHFRNPAPSREVRLVHHRGALKALLLTAFVTTLLDSLPTDLR
jgi:LysR family hydrogen peroxide-inducible transcriptional activator